MISSSALAADLAGSEWGVDKPFEQFVNFSGSNKLSGNSGCNSFFGSYKIDKPTGKISIGPLASTRKACRSEIMKAEFNFLKNLENAKSFQRSSHKLELLDEKGNLLMSLRHRDFD